MRSGVGAAWPFTLLDLRFEDFPRVPLADALEAVPLFAAADVDEFVPVPVTPVFWCVVVVDLSVVPLLFCACMAAMAGELPVPAARAANITALRFHFQNELGIVRSMSLLLAVRRNHAREKHGHHPVRQAAA